MQKTKQFNLNQLGTFVFFLLLFVLGIMFTSQYGNTPPTLSQANNTPTVETSGAFDIGKWFGAVFAKDGGVTEKTTAVLVFGGIILGGIVSLGVSLAFGSWFYTKQQKLSAADSAKKAKK
jgi:hypothetical protein